MNLWRESALRHKLLMIWWVIYGVGTPYLVDHWWPILLAVGFGSVNIWSMTIYAKTQQLRREIEANKALIEGYYRAIEQQYDIDEEWRQLND